MVRKIKRSNTCFINLIDYDTDEDDDDDDDDDDEVNYNPCPVGVVLIETQDIGLQSKCLVSV